MAFGHWERGLADLCHWLRQIRHSDNVGNAAIAGHGTDAANDYFSPNGSTAVNTSIRGNVGNDGEQCDAPRTGRGRSPNNFGPLETGELDPPHPAEVQWVRICSVAWWVIWAMSS